MQRRNRGSVLLGALMVVWNVGSAMAAPPAPGTAPIVPRPLATGFSTIEQRYVYAPPDKGRLEIPLALGTGTGAELRRPLGIAIVGGLLFSQVLTLFTTPVIYLVLDRYTRRETSPSAATSPSRSCSPS